MALPWREPRAAFRAACHLPDIAFLLSQGVPGPRARHSYLCFQPETICRLRAGRVQCGGQDAGADLFTVLRHALRRHAPREAPVPFAGGAVGFFGYDAAAQIAGIAPPAGDFAGVPDAHFAIYTRLIAWDHAARQCWLIGAAPSELPFAWPEDGPVPPPPPPALALRWRAGLSRAAHEARVARAQALIAAGDIYQANITAPFHAARPQGLPAARIFDVAAAKNPAPFSAFLPCGGGAAVASLSPERFISLSRGGMLETRPIKGTRPRHADAARDAEAAEELCASGKDRAENLMIVDLMRNDLARAARPGTVRVPALCELESFASVHHLVSSVTAVLAPGADAFDVLRAALPGGSITGAPKIRAMQIIAALEGAPRGPYCGISAWIGFDGAMDSAILIRTVTIAQDRLVAQAGGGIVAESDPAAEWDELMAKISPLLAALGETTQCFG